MLNAFLLAAITTSIMGISNYKNVGFQASYEIATKKSWQTLTFMSFWFGVLLGMLSYYGMIVSENSGDALYFAVMGAVVGYAGIQAIYTDFALLQVDRWTLRVGYLIILVMNVVYTFGQYSGRTLLFSLFMILLIYTAMFAVFLFSGVGASDVRALTILIPFLFIVNNAIGLGAFILVSVYVSVMVWVEQRKLGKKQPVPILPYMFMPYILITPLYGFITNAYQRITL